MGPMLFVFGDEFGDFSTLSNNHGSYRPVCGYGGIVVPASEVESLERGFLQIKLMVAGANLRGKLEDVAARKNLGGDWVAQAMRDAHRRRNLLRNHEIKGREVFSQRYWSKREAEWRKRRTLLRITKLFLQLLARHTVRIVFFGEHKLGQTWIDSGLCPNGRDPHVRLIRNFLEVVQAAAAEDGCPASVYMDHHPSDLPSKNYRKAQSNGEKPYLQPALQTRMEYARQQILQNDWAVRLQGTIHSVDSEWSSFIQMADWACTLVTNWVMYEAEPLDFSRYKPLHGAVDPFMRQYATKGSLVRMPPRSLLSWKDRREPPRNIRPLGTFQTEFAFS